MKANILPLREAEDVWQVGGKAAALGRMIRARLPVPNGFVVTVAAYEKHVERVLSKLGENPSEKEIAEAILRTGIDKQFEEFFREAWHAFIPSKAAVRSSATVEDSETASFAGQFLSELNVSSVEQALKAVRRCWASLYSAHAIAYSKSQAKSSPPPKMAVVVQQMVDALYAGVAFTREPVTGSDDVAVAEWVTGFGESLVSGQSVGGRVWLNTKGETLRADFLQECTSAPDKRVWKQLNRNLRRVIKVFGPNQDVEWAWSREEKLFLLQARPDTQNIDRIRESEGPPPWILPGQPLGGWTEEQRSLFDLWDEYNPPVIEPLDFFLFYAAIWQASIDMLDTGKGVPDIKRVVILYEMVPVMIDPAARVKPPRWRFLRGRCYADFESAIQRLPKRVKKLEQEAGNLSAISDEKLVRLLDKAATLYRNVQVTRLLKGMNLWIEGEEKAKKTLRQILQNLDVDVNGVIETLEAGVDHETARMNRALRELVFAAKKGKTKQWYQQLDDFLRRYGHFEVEGKLLRESRESIIEQVDRMLEAGVESSDIDAPRKRVERLLEELLARIPEDEKRRGFDQAVRELRHWVALRDNSKTIPEMVLPLIKRLQREAGKRLVQRGLLQQPEQINLLTPEELEIALQAGIAIEREVIQRRSALVRWKQDHPSWLPAHFLGNEYGPDDLILYGIAASAGIAEGVARIVHGPDEFGKVQKGDIVIARSTNPAWTQLFTRISGIAVENGSRLSHAAVVAREVGIPAVVGIPGLMSAIRNGERLRIDGSAGEIIRLGLQEKCNV